MGEPSVTASAIISFIEKLENDSSKFYEKLAEKYAESKQTFLSFAEESKKNKLLVLRTYQETITDALEACFSFEGLDLSDHLAEMTLIESTSYEDALKIAIELEERANKFYIDVAERSKSLLATIPRVFRKVAERRESRKLELELLLNNLT